MIDRSEGTREIANFLTRFFFLFKKIKKSHTNG